MTNENDSQLLASSIVTLDRLREALDYDSETGLFYWKIARPGMQIGDLAGSLDTKGYVVISIDNQRYKASSLAWYYIHGEFVIVDHEDTVPANNAIGNLRKASYSQNNHRKYIYNPLGVKGVRFRSGKYQAHIRIEGIITRIGAYDTLEEAGEAYKRKAREVFGEFAND